MFYKAIKDGKIVDVFSDTDIVFIRFDAFLNTPLRCGANDSPFGVLASDSSVIYAITSVDGYDSITLKNFEDESEYNQLKEELAAAKTPEYIEPENPSESEEVDPSVLDTVPITAEEALNIIMGVYE